MDLLDVYLVRHNFECIAYSLYLLSLLIKKNIFANYHILTN